MKNPLQTALVIAGLLLWIAGLWLIHPSLVILFLAVAVFVLVEIGIGPGQRD